MAMARPEHAALAADGEPGPERLHALCDGVVAIAITVLALELKLPEPDGAPLRETLAHLLPNAMAFLLSFTVIGGFWLAHHRLLRRVRRTSRGYNLASLGFMLAVVSLNLPTAALARYGDTDPWAVMLYAAVVAATGAMLLLAVGIAHAQRLVAPAATAADHRAAVAVLAWPTLVFAASIPLAPLHPLGAMIGWTLAALGPVVRRWARRSAATAAASPAPPESGRSPVRPC
jgi:uncharacterized membrane protein